MDISGTGAAVDVLAIDVGGSGIKAARYDRDGLVLEAFRVPTPPPSRLADEVTGVARRLRGPGTAAVGVVAPGVIADGVLRYAVNLGVRDLPLRELVRETVALPTTLGHDLAAAALAESAAGKEDLLFVGLGTGIAAGLVTGGELWRGANGMAGELGHVCVVPGGEPCGCGRLGCLEVYASAAGIARRYAVRTGSAAPGLDAAAIAGRLAGDPAAAAVWAEAVEALSEALATAVLLLDPATVVLGGGLALAGPALFDPVRAGLRARLRWRPAPEVRPALLGADASRAGAALLAWRLLDDAEVDTAAAGELPEEGAGR
ncbi:ROK family protein [Jatrophihabitans sp.]|uniref:ROK family protein n=1 Tax=Jatrophihabitans sp. TaxID=1932789 RepID=UPI002CE0C259|nr:ROK family protein [Jatrophihabitans sp.]